MEKHPRDISDAVLNTAMQISDRPDLVSGIVGAARESFGFFPSLYYAVCYAWLMDQLETLPAGSRVLDVGAGVSPLPLLLAQNGMRVESVDASDTTRVLPVSPNWNEWGYFDYATLDQRIRSHHRNCLDFAPDHPCDAIYSAFMLAHMTRADRRKALQNFTHWLAPGGLLVLVVDLMPATDFIWNRSEGREVEPPEKHGLFDDLKSEIAALGLEMQTSRILRGLEGSRTDQGLVACTKPRH